MKTCVRVAHAGLFGRWGHVGAPRMVPIMLGGFVLRGMATAWLVGGCGRNRAASDPCGALEVSRCVRRGGGASQSGEQRWRGCVTGAARTAVFSSWTWNDPSAALDRSGGFLAVVAMLFFASKFPQLCAQYFSIIRNFGCARDTPTNHTKVTTNT